MPVHYRGEVDGDIREYLRDTHLNGINCPTFIGYEPYAQMWALGVITPEITSIRLMFGFVFDEHYYIIDKDNAEGVNLRNHSGKEGLHNTKDLLIKTKAPY